MIRRYHEFMDGIVGDILAGVPEDAVILMLSDHGFEDRFAHSQAPDGFAQCIRDEQLAAMARDLLFGLE